MSKWIYWENDKGLKINKISRSSLRVITVRSTYTDREGNFMYNGKTIAWLGFRTPQTQIRYNAIFLNGSKFIRLSISKKCLKAAKMLEW
jgi:hypothetical protein